MDHWKKKIAEETEKLAKAEAAASDVQAEFEVTLTIYYVFTVLISVESMTALDSESRRIL